MVPSNEHQTSIVHKQGNNFEISAMAGRCIFVCLSPPRLISQISSAGTTVSKALISLLRAKMPENAKKAGKKSFKGGINVKS